MQKTRLFSKCNLTTCALFITGLMAAMFAILTIAAQAAPERQSSANGEAIFKAKCTACHTIGAGKLVGPDLKGVTLRRDKAWLTSWIKAPDKVLASGDPIAAKLLADANNVPMPNLGLSDSDVADLIAYFESVDSTAAATPSQGAVASTPSSLATATLPPPLTGVAEVLELNGDPAIGQQMFTGAQRLQHDGIPCIACHTVEGIGVMGGGAVGPNLTHVYHRYGRAGLASALVNIPFPTMQGAFAGKPLTADEQANLLAFFQNADRGGPPSNRLNFWLLVGAGLALTVLFLLVMVYFWPQQSMSIAERLRRDGKV